MFASVADGILEVADLGRVGDVAGGSGKVAPPVRKSGTYKKYHCTCCAAIARGKKDMKLFCGNEHAVTEMLEDGSDAHTAWKINQLLKVASQSTDV
jgi:hypothetical protein